MAFAHISAVLFASLIGAMMSFNELDPSTCILVPLPTSSSEEGAINYMLANTIRCSNTSSLRLVPIHRKSEFDTLVYFVSTIFKNGDGAGNMCSEVIGVVGDLDVTTASTIHTLARSQDLNITLVPTVLPSVFSPTLSRVLPNFLDMNPFTHYLEALVKFCSRLNWTRIALVRDDTYHYQYAAELLQIHLENEIVPHVSLELAASTDSFHRAFDGIKEHGTHVVVMLMNDACLLLKEAHSQDLMWPNYAWIVLEFDLYKETRACYPENTIIFSTTMRADIVDNSTCARMSKECTCLYEMNSTTYKTNINAEIFRDSIYLVAGRHYVPGFNGELEFKQISNVSIFQTINFSPVEVAQYDAYSEKLGVIHSDFYTFILEGGGPLGVKAVIEFQTPPVGEAILVLALVLCFIFVTTILTLYIYFRKEPEIRATSVSVSLSMFLGCYLMLAYVPLHYAVGEKNRATPLNGKVACNALLWLSGVGLSMSLIIATLTVKMLRVYIIFFKPLSYKKKLFSDPVLFLYILMLVSPTAFILILWLAVNPLDHYEDRIVYKSYIYVIQACKAENQVLLWYGALIIYTMFLLMALSVLAFKTSKIRYKNFKDTKEVNAFAFIVVFAIILTFIHWWFHRYVLPLTSQNLTASLITVYTGHIFIVTSCQICLFLPKICSAIKRLRLNIHPK